MDNVIYFENGIKHILTKDEMKILKIVLKEFDKSDLLLITDLRDQELIWALNNLKDLFLGQSD